MDRGSDCRSVSPQGLRDLIWPSFFILVHHLLKDHVEGLIKRFNQLVYGRVAPRGVISFYLVLGV